MRGLIFIFAALAVAALCYQLDTSWKELAALQGKVQQQNDSARAQLDALTLARDRAQAQLDRAAQAQETHDAHAQDQIQRLRADLLRGGPVRVRLQPGPGRPGPGSGSPPDQAAAHAGPGSADPGPAYGLLPAESAERLAGALTDVETLSAAYTSCRATLESIETVLETPSPGVADAPQD